MHILLDIMARIPPTLFPAMVRQLADLGARLRLARLRRRYSAVTVAARAGITRVTLSRVEKGDPGTGLGAYVSVMRVLGLQTDLDAVARDDALGHKLRDLDLPERSAGPRRGGRTSEAAS
jgi:transcriptional regulator with XRE-family HTH domain